MSAAEPLLLSAISKMLVTYLPDNDTSAVCKIIQSYDPDPNRQPCPFWSNSYARVEATQTMAKVITQADAMRMLGFIGQFAPTMQSCPSQLLGLTLQEYGVLWSTVVADKSFCRVRLYNTTINYDPISQVQAMLKAGAATAGAVGIIINEYRDSLPWLDPVSMKTSCSSRMSYSDMGGAQGNPLQALCGCYLDFQNVEEFSTDEKSILAQKPQCAPSCLDAAVKYSVGGVPITCQQKVCIADQINVTGDSTTISQVCSQCPQRFQCVCYVHINGQTLDNKACNTVYTVNDKGQIIGTTHNNAPSAGQTVRNIFATSFKKPVVMGVIIGGAALLTIAIITLLILQHTRSGTKKKTNAY